MGVVMQNGTFKNKLKSVFSLLFLGIGVSLIFLGTFADRLGLGKSHTSSHIGPLEKFCILIGIAVIVVWIVFRRYAHILGANVFIFLVIIALLDPILFYCSPWLPIPLVVRMSTAAQNNYSRFHKGQQRYIEYKKLSAALTDRCYSDWHGRPNGSGFEFTYAWQYDEYGYRNPSGYFRDNKPDVLLIGDSFTEGSESAVTMADYLRQYWFPRKVYSLGMSNASPYNWLCQYRQYKQNLSGADQAKIIFINLCGANDFSLKNDIANSNSAMKVKQSADVGNEGIVMNPQENKSRLPFKNEFFMVLEKITEESLVKALLHPKKYALFNHILNGIGIKADQWVTPVAFYNAPEYSTIDFEKLKGQLDEFVQEVVRDGAGAHVVLSYIPTRAEICDRSVRDSGDQACRKEIANQERVSERLKGISDQVGIKYIDITADLRNFSAGFNETLYMPNGHFTLFGNDLYAQFLMKQGQLAPSN